MASSTANKNNNNQDDIVEAISALARVRDISEDMLLSTVEEACKAAFRRSGKQGPGAPMNLSVIIARKKPVQVIARKVIVEEVEDPNIQISLAEARAVRPDFQLGDIVEIDVTPKDFGRVAAQTAKQVIVQRIREAERGKIYDEYVEKENEILTAIVQRVEPKAVYVELGLAVVFMMIRRPPRATLFPVTALFRSKQVLVQRTRGDAQRTPQVYVSRIHPGLVKRLFEMEVPEIANGIVQIKSIAREAGSRTKMAVYSSELMIDPVGACVGPRGSRVEKVISELRNEKIDIIKWSPDPAEFVANALNPAHVVSVFISDAEKICRVVVPDSQLSLAIGKEGQNARLAAKLTGWKIDIKSETQFAEQLREQGLTMEEAMGGEAPAQQDVDFADDYYPQQDQDAGYEQ